jgi:hypothetical protein
MFEVLLMIDGWWISHPAKFHYKGTKNTEYSQTIAVQP